MGEILHVCDSRAELHCSVVEKLPLFWISVLVVLAQRRIASMAIKNSHRDNDKPPVIKIKIQYFLGLTCRRIKFSTSQRKGTKCTACENSEKLSRIKWKEYGNSQGQS